MPHLIAELEKAFDVGWPNRVELGIAAPEALGKIGPEAKDAVPQLVEALKTPFSRCAEPLLPHCCGSAPRPFPP